MTAIPDPQQTLWSTYVYYVVNLCPCGHSYYYPSRRQIRMDDLTPHRLRQEIEEIPRRIDTKCGECGRHATPLDARRAVLGVGMPDRTGCILCDFGIEQGEVETVRFRFDSASDPIEFFREHPDYFRTRPPDGSPTDFDDYLCLDELGRVLNVRSCWNDTLGRALEEGAAFTTIQDGYYLFATTAVEPHEIQCQMKELASEKFWEYFHSESIPRRRLVGIDNWTDEQRADTGFQEGIYSDWLKPELVKFINDEVLYAISFSIESVAFDYLAKAATHYDLRVEELIPADGSPSEWWIHHPSGLSRPFPPLELLQLHSIYRGVVLSDQIWMTFQSMANAIDKEVEVYKKLCMQLPSGFRTEWEELGKLRVYREDHPLELLTFAHVADQIDPNDDEALSRLISWLISEKKCECSRYVGKRLMSRERFQECVPQMMREPEAFLYQEKDEKFVEIYTDECPHHVMFGLRKAGGDIQFAEDLFVQDLNEQNHSLRFVKRRSFLGGTQMIAFIGRDAASISTHPALIKGAMDELNLNFGSRIRVFAPFNGILTVSSPKVELERLEKFAYEVAREVPGETELKSDHLGYHALLELADDPLGSFTMEALTIHS